MDKLDKTSKQPQQVCIAIYLSLNVLRIVIALEFDVVHNFYYTCLR